MRTALLLSLLIPTAAWAQDPAPVDNTALLRAIEAWVPPQYDWTSEAGAMLKQACEEFGNSRIATASDLFTRARDKDPRLPKHDVWMSALLAIIGNYDASYDYLERAAMDTPEDPRVWGLYAIIQLNQGHVGAAMALLDRADARLAAATLDDGFAARCRYQLLIARGRSADMFGLWQHGLDSFRELNKTTPEPMFHIGEAKMHYKMGHDDAAREILNKPIVKEAHSTPAEQYLAGWSTDDRDYEAAGKWYAILVKNEPENATLAYGHGMNLRARGRYREAEAEIERSVELGYTELAEVEMQKGYIAFALGKYPDAEQHFALVHSAAPDNPVVTTFYALSLIESDDVSKRALAYTLGQRLIGREGATYSDAGTVAWIEFRKGNTEDAIKSIEVAMNNPDDNTLYFRAVIHEYMKESEKALALLNVICERDGNFSYRDTARRFRDNMVAERKTDAPSAVKATTP